jgi:hypothetical protein
MYRLEREMREM